MLGTCEDDSMASDFLFVITVSIRERDDHDNASILSYTIHRVSLEIGKSSLQFYRSVLVSLVEVKPASEQ